MLVDDKRFLASLKLLASTYRVELVDGTIAAYAIALEGVPPELLMEAAREAAKTSEFFPTPAKLRAIAKALGHRPRLRLLPRLVANDPRESWSAAVATPNYAECEASCRRNAEIAEQRVAALRAQVRDMVPGPELDRIRSEASRPLAEARHWRDMRGWYQRAAAQRGGDRQVPSWPGAPVPRPSHWADREPGEDDDEPTAKDLTGQRNGAHDGASGDRW